MGTFGESTVEDFLASVAARRSAPGGGAVCAVTVAAAAGLVAMSARYSSDGGAPALAAEADAERAAVLALADADAAAYGEVLAAMRAPTSDPARADRLRKALEGAAEVPLRIAQAGERVARTGVAVAAGGNPNLAGDVRTAVLLAEAAARAAAELVRINVESGGLDAAVDAAARDAVAGAAEATRRLTHSP
ncbi:cyclodeaminase/cyclohydrolase family protein [Pseudonocardia lacus]|uniref:cyclodeaminase/cyclohydrolase family protein n=1 Tax=Pseudonocardia lacus TaxID=2835865 RepID=UPI001BDD9581|nr:cyclodeaminase/cyclohydrolase family protein [Pseudonocardia lacus]